MRKDDKKCDETGKKFGIIGILLVSNAYEMMMICWQSMVKIK